MLQQNEIQAVIDEVISRIVKQTGQSPSGTDSAANALQTRVITTAQVPSGSEEGSLVILRQDAVITPAAKDLFRERGIRFQRVPVKAGPNGDGNLLGELFVVDCDRNRFESLESRLGTSQTYDCVVKASANAALKCRQGKRVVMITAAPEVAVIALSRHESVRPVEALSLERPEVVQQRINATVANVLVISDTLATHWRVVRMVETFIGQEFAAIPAWL